MPDIMKTLMTDRANNFRAAFETLTKGLFFEDDQKRSYQNGEYGGYRERLVVRFLKSFLSPRYSFGEGFLINSKGGLSGQTDVVIYDAVETPPFEDPEFRRFYPIECAYAAGSIKSKLDKYKLKEALQELMKTKFLREVEPQGLPVSPNSIVLSQMSADGWNWEPHEIEYQNIVSFLVCESIEGLETEGDLSSMFNSLYAPSMAGIPRRHNLILSLRDGYIGYARKGESYPFPQKDRVSTGYQWVKASDDQAHVIQFAHDLSFALSRTCVFSFNAADYLPKVERVYAPMGR